MPKKLEITLFSRKFPRVQNSEIPQSIREFKFTDPKAIREIPCRIATNGRATGATFELIIPAGTRPGSSWSTGENVRTAFTRGVPRILHASELVDGVGIERHAKRRGSHI